MEPSRDLPFPTASWGRRILALVVDWAACWLVVALVSGGHSLHDGNGSWWVLGAFFVESVGFTAAVGGSFGQIATRLRVARIDGDPRPLDPVRAVARQILVVAVVPPLIFRSADGRGLHDLAVGSAAVTLGTWRGLAGRA